MTKTQSPASHTFTNFPLPDYYEDDATVDAALPSTTRPPGSMSRSPGAPHMSQPKRDLRPPQVQTESEIDRLSAEIDRWGREVTQWTETTFSQKLDGIVGGKIRSRSAADGTIVFATGLDHYPDCVIVQPREPVNFLRAYVLPEEERHLAKAAKNLVLAPGDVVVKCILFDVEQGG
ncbi:MAG: hypothetical protein LC118_13845 [Dehalococcoidia bacterium]|nr:hypothetical protein [Dehalococcoidia bacterium]